MGDTILRMCLIFNLKEVRLQYYRNCQKVVRRHSVTTSFVWHIEMAKNKGVIQTHTLNFSSNSLVPLSKTVNPAVHDPWCLTQKKISIITGAWVKLINKDKVFCQTQNSSMVHLEGGILTGIRFLGESKTQLIQNISQNSLKSNKHLYIIIDSTDTAVCWSQKDSLQPYKQEYS